MKSAFAAISLIALLTIGIAGPLTMLHGLDHGSSCPIAAAVKLPCLTMGNITAHIASLQDLLTAVPATLALALLALLSFAILRVTTAFVIHSPPPKPTTFFETLTYAAIGSRNALTRWQMRLAHSPTFA